MKAKRGILSSLYVSLVVLIMLVLPVLWMAPTAFAEGEAVAPAAEVSHPAAPSVAVSEPAAPAAAPVAAAADPVKASLIQRVLDALLAFLPGLMSFLAIYITQGVSFLWGKLSPSTAASLSTVMGGAIAAICAAIFPGVIPPDVAAALGAGGGAAGHLLGQKAPIETK